MKLGWVVLTMGDRWPQTRAALQSIVEHSPGEPIVLVLNGCAAPRELVNGVNVLKLPENVGIPAGRAAGLAALDSTIDIVGFLDDDALLRTPSAGKKIVDEFASDDQVGVVAMRIVDEEGLTAQRHVPRLGNRGSSDAGEVVTFLGGACAIRRIAYEVVGGYWGELFYSHEELEIAWRLHDAGYTVRYEPDLLVEHPRTEIGRHADGWTLTGRNRVLIARRNLPWLVAVAHTLIWFGAGLLRAPGRDCKLAYAKGWFTGWRGSVPRSSMRWRTVFRLGRLGRPPII